MDHGTHYEVCVHLQAELAPTWSTVLADLAIVPQPDGTTLLRGTLADQAAVHGLLAAIRDLGLSMLSVEAFTTPPSASRPGGS